MDVECTVWRYDAGQWTSDHASTSQLQTCTRQWSSCCHPHMPHHTLQCDCCTFRLDVQSASSHWCWCFSVPVFARQLYVGGAFVHCICALHWYTKCTSKLTISPFRAAGVLWAHRRSALWPIHTRWEGSGHWRWGG